MHNESSPTTEASSLTKTTAGRFSILGISLVLGWICAFVLLNGCQHQTELPQLETGASSAEIEHPNVEITLAEPTASDPATLGAAISALEVAQGFETALVIRGKLADGWHIYSVDGPTAGSIATKFKLELPAGVKAVGDWKLPHSHTIKNALGEEQAVYDGELWFVQPIKVTDAAALGEQEVRCEVTYQTCNDQSCLPPKTIALAAKLVVASTPADAQPATEVSEAPGPTGQ